MNHLLWVDHWLDGGRRRTWNVDLQRYHPKPLIHSIALIDSRAISRSATHHSQCHERTHKLVSVTSKSPNGQGKLRQLPVDAVTR